jgi:hypothetical protein
VGTLLWNASIKLNPFMLNVFTYRMCEKCGGVKIRLNMFNADAGIVPARV